MKKIILRILIASVLISILSIGAGIWYIQAVFIPRKLKPLIIETVQKTAKVKIGLKNVLYQFPRQFSLREVTLFEQDIPSQKLLEIEQLNIHFKLLAILFKKQIIVNRVELKTLQIYPGPGRTFTSKGDIFIDGEFLYKINDPKNISYDAVITLKNHDIKNMPFVKNISHLNGRIKIVPDKISIIELKGESFGCPVEFSGFLENFKDPRIDLAETINLDLSKIDNFLSAKISKSIKSITLSGRSDVILHMSGKFSEWPLKFNGSARILNAEAKIKNVLNPVKSITGSVTFDENSISIPALDAEYNNISYDIKGNLTNFNAPSVYLALTSRDLSLEAKIRTIDDYIRFDSVEGSWFNSTLSLVGEIQNYQKSELKLTGEAKVNLDDIRKILSRMIGRNEKLDNFMKGLNLKGICNMSIFIDALINDLADCEIGIKAGSENMGIGGFNLGAMDASAQLKNKLLSIPKFDLTPYDGTLKIQANINFSPGENMPGPEYAVDINSAGLNLEKLIKDTNLKDKNIRGTESLNCSLRGSGSDLATLKGQGWIMISNGRLWEFPLLGELANILSMPQLRNIQINSAEGNFIIADKKISTDNLKFTSPQLNMETRGSLGFSGDLDFNIGLNFAPGFGEINQLAKLAIVLADETGRFLGQVKLSGTIKEPKYAFVPFHLDKILGKLFKKQ